MELHATILKLVIYIDKIVVPIPKTSPVLPTTLGKGIVDQKLTRNEQYERGQKIFLVGHLKDI